MMLATLSRMLLVTLLTVSLLADTAHDSGDTAHYSGDAANDSGDAAMIPVARWHCL